MRGRQYIVVVTNTLADVAIGQSCVSASGVLSYLHEERKRDILVTLLL